MSAKNITQIDSVVTSLLVIEVLAAAAGPMRLKDISRELCITAPRVHRHLSTLKRQGYVEQEPDTERYFLTAKLLHLGHSVAKQSDFLAVARRMLVRLNQESGLSASVGMIEEQGVRIIDIYRQKSEVEITTWPGTLFSFDCSAQGKVAIAFGTSLLGEEVGPPYDAKLAALEAASALLSCDELDTIRKQGWADAPGRVLTGINAVAAPVFDCTGLVGTVSIIGDLEQLPSPPTERQIAVVKKSASSISWQLGYAARQIA